MTFSVYFIHGPQLLLLQVCSLSAKNPINLSAISALFLHSLIMVLTQVFRAHYCQSIDIRNRKMKHPFYQPRAWLGLCAFQQNLTPAHTHIWQGHTCLRWYFLRQGDKERLRRGYYLQLVAHNINSPWYHKGYTECECVSGDCFKWNFVHEKIFSPYTDSHVKAQIWFFFSFWGLVGAYMRCWCAGLDDGMFSQTLFFVHFCFCFLAFGF